MARGLAREQSKAKNLKKNTGGKKQDDSGLTPQQRNERDALAQAEKKKRKEEQKAALIASGADGAAQVAAEEARKQKLNAAKKERRDYNKNTRVAKENGLTKPGQGKGPSLRGQPPPKAQSDKDGTTKTAEPTLKELEAELMPLVKRGDEHVKIGEISAGLGLFQQAMDGFRAAGHKRPKLKEKIDAAKEMLIQQQVERDAAAASEPAPEPQPAVDVSVEVDVSVDETVSVDATPAENEDDDMDDNEC